MAKATHLMEPKLQNLKSQKHPSTSPMRYRESMKQAQPLSNGKLAETAQTEDEHEDQSYSSEEEDFKITTSFALETVKDSGQADSLRSTPESRRKQHAQNPHADFGARTSDEDSDLGYVLKKATKRRRHSDAPYKVSDPDESDGEYTLKKRQKRRKTSDGVFRPTKSLECSDEDDLEQSNKRKRRRTPPSAAKRLAGKTSTQSPSPSAQRVSSKRSGPSSPDAVSQANKDIAIQLQAMVKDDKTITSSLVTEGTTRNTQVGKRKRGVEDRTYRAGKGDDSTESDKLSEGIFKRAARRKATPRRKASAQPRHIKQEPSSSRSNRNVSPPKHIKHEPGSSRSNGSGKTRRSSLYTKANANRDEQPDSPLSDLDEPDTKRRTTDDMHDLSIYLNELRQQKLAQLAEEQQGQKADWLSGEMALYEKLLMREVEPQLPVTWKRDFNTLPLRRFALNDEDTPVKAAWTDERHPTNDFRASKAFQELVSLGALARDKSSLRERPEQLLKHGIEQYIKWSETDALKNRHYVKRLLVVCDDTDDKMNPDLAVSKLHDNIQRLALAHRQAYIEDNKLHPRRVRVAKPYEQPMTPDTSDLLLNTSYDVPNEHPQPQRRKSSFVRSLFRWTAWAGLFGRPVPAPVAANLARSTLYSSIEYDHDPDWDSDSSEVDPRAEYKLIEPELPEDMGIIYGILITGLFVQIVSYHIAEPEGECHNVLVCDFSKETQDIWNALAVAITVCHVRDEILELTWRSWPSHESDFYDEDI